MSVISQLAGQAFLETQRRIDDVVVFVDTVFLQEAQNLVKTQQTTLDTPEAEINKDTAKIDLISSKLKTARKEYATAQTLIHSVYNRVNELTSTLESDLVTRRAQLELLEHQMRQTETRRQAASTEHEISPPNEDR